MTTGLNLALFRAYDPELGRWLSRDPIGLRGGINLYGYVKNDPIHRTDLLGLQGLPASSPGPLPEAYYDDPDYTDIETTSVIPEISTMLPSESLPNGSTPDQLKALYEAPQTYLDSWEHLHPVEAERILNPYPASSAEPNRPHTAYLQAPSRHTRNPKSESLDCLARRLYQQTLQILRNLASSLQNSNAQTGMAGHLSGY